MVSSNKKHDYTWKYHYRVNYEKSISILETGRTITSQYYSPSNIPLFIISESSVEISKYASTTPLCTAIFCLLVWVPCCLWDDMEGDAPYH